MEPMGSGQMRFCDSYLFSEDVFDLIAAYRAGRDLQEELDDLIIRHYLTERHSSLRTFSVIAAGDRMGNHAVRSSRA